MCICTFVFILFHWCPKRFPCQMTLGSLSINTTCDSNGAGTAYPSGAPELLIGFVLFNVYFCVVYCYSLFVLFPLSIVLFYPSSICGLCLLLWYLRTFLSGITFIPYSLIVYQVWVCIWYVVEPNYGFYTTGRESADGSLYWR